MLRSLFLTVSTVVLLSAGAGCDQQAQSNQQAEKALADATALIARTDLRYIPAGEEQEQSWATYREKLFKEALPQLDQVIADAPEAQKNVAQQLKAQVLLSLARMKADNAVREFRDISSYSGAALEQLATTNTSGLRVQSLSFSEKPAIDSLDKTMDQLKKQQAQLASQRDQLKKQITDLTAQAKKLRDDAQAKMAESDTLSRKGFVASGQEKYKLEDDSADAELASAGLIAQAEQLEAQAENNQSLLSMVNRQIELIAANVASLDEAAKSAAKRDKTRDESLQASRGASVASANNALVSVQAMLDRFQTDVDVPLEEAAKGFGQAADIFAAASKSGDADARRAANQSELTARVDQVQTLTSHVVAIGDLARFIRFLNTASLNLTSEQKQALQKAYDQLQTHQAELIAQLTAEDTGVLPQTMTMANEASTSDAPSPAVGTLQTYQQMASAATLK